VQCIFYGLNDEFMMGIKLNKQNVRYVQLYMFVLSKNRNKPVPVPPSVYLQPLPAKSDRRRPC